MLDAVGKEALAAEAAKIARCAGTVKSAIRCFADGHGTEPSQLYGEPIERAVASICHPARLGSVPTGMAVAALEAVARLHYARYHASPFHPAPYLWSAATLFRIIRPASSVPVRVPGDIALMLDVLAVDDLAAVPGLDDLAEAADTATRIAEYASVQRDLVALSRAEELICRVLDSSPAADPDRAVYLNTLLGILVARCQWGGTAAVEELIALVDLVDAPARRADPRWPNLQANAGGASYVVAVHTQDLALLDRSVGLIGSAVRALPDDSLLTA